MICLASCSISPKTNPSSVKIFQNTPSIKMEFQGQDSCIWKTAEIPVFNSKKESIKFDYLRCQNDEEILFNVKNGNEIFVQSSEGEKHILSIWKLDPHRDKEFVESLLMNKSQEKCSVFQNEKNNWKIGLKELDRSSGNGWVMYPSLSEPMYADVNGVCGPYAFGLENDWTIRINDGIGVAYLEFLETLGFYDLNSITYKNKG